MAEGVAYVPTQAELMEMRYAAGGGSPLVRAAMRLWCRPHSAQITIDVPDDPGPTRDRIRDLLKPSGQLIDDPNGTDSSAADGAIWAGVRSGVGNLTWSLIRVEVTPGPAGGSSVHIRATGLEGLIKQRIAAKAVDRLAEGLRPTSA